MKRSRPNTITSRVILQLESGLLRNCTRYFFHEQLFSGLNSNLRLNTRTSDMRLGHSKLYSPGSPEFKKPFREKDCKFSSIDIDNRYWCFTRTALQKQLMQYLREFFPYFLVRLCVTTFTIDCRTLAVIIRLTGESNFNIDIRPDSKNIDIRSKPSCWKYIGFRKMFKKF